MTARAHLRVVAAVIERDRRFLVTRRQAGVHLSGLWEFPGGKAGHGEPDVAALQRELLEELAAPIVVGDLLLHTTHAYPDRDVLLYFYRCDLMGTPVPQLGQEMAWVERDRLTGLSFPPADEELIRMLTSA